MPRTLLGPPPRSSGQTPGRTLRPIRSCIPQLKAQLHELRLRTGDAVPDVPMLLRLINEHYVTIERERRGIVESMRLMADEAQALAHEARAQSSEHLQVILDHIKDVVLLVDEAGVIRTFNPTGERVFGYGEAEVIGQRIDLLLPQDRRRRKRARGAAAPGREPGRYRAGSRGARAVGAAQEWRDCFRPRSPSARRRCRSREMFVLCLRDVTERRETEQAMRESAARYQPAGRSRPGGHRHAGRRLGTFHGCQRQGAEALRPRRARSCCELGPRELQPAAAARRRCPPRSARAATSSVPLPARCRCSSGCCAMPRARDRLRGAPGAPAERRTAAWYAAASPTSPRASVPSRMAAGRAAGVRADDAQRAAARRCWHRITALIESAIAGAAASRQRARPEGQAVSPSWSPRSCRPRCAQRCEHATRWHPQRLLRRVRLLGRQVLVADVAQAIRSGSDDAQRGARGRAARRLGDADQGRRRPACSGRSASTAPRSACRARPRREVMARAAQLAGIAIERRRSEEALRSSEAKFRGLFESMPEGVYQCGRDGRDAVGQSGVRQPCSVTAARRRSMRCPAAALYCNPAERAEFARASRGRARSTTRSSSCAAATVSSWWCSRTPARCAMRPAASPAMRARSPTSPSASAPSRRCSPRRSAPR